MTQTQEKAEQTLDAIYSKSLGGSVGHPDVAQFRTQVENASPRQIVEADQKVWQEIITPLSKAGMPIPTSVVEQCALLADRMHKLFVESNVGAGSRSGS